MLLKKGLITNMLGFSFSNISFRVESFLFPDVSSCVHFNATTDHSVAEQKTLDIYKIASVVIERWPHTLTMHRACNSFCHIIVLQYVSFLQLLLRVLDRT